MVHTPPGPTLICTLLLLIEFKRVTDNTYIYIDVWDYFFFSIHGFKKLDLARRLISSIFFSRDIDFTFQ